MKFCKMTGSGNDFIAVNNIDGAMDVILDREMISALCTRALSIGADGVLEMRRSDRADFRMVYYNSDGGRASMCGNGGRCIAKYAVLESVCGPSMVFESDRGLHKALVSGDGSVRLWLGAPLMIRDRIEIEAHPVAGGDESEIITAAIADTGVPHFVLFREDIHDGLFEKSAPVLRRHEAAGRDGANVDFIRIEARNAISIRTWERGVEGETLACGTGAVAAVFIGAAKGLIDLPCTVTPAGGSSLRVGRDESGWWLEGEARPVYSGETIEPRP